MLDALNVDILIFDDVEVLDFAGPFEVFTVTGRVRGEQPFNVHTVSQSEAPVKTRGGLSVQACCTLETCPVPDILVVPGGYGTRREMRNPQVVDWIVRTAPHAGLVLSVCTGSLLLGQAGLLDGLESTTHHTQFALLAETAPCTTVRSDRRVIDNGKIVTAAGISAGIDAALYVVARLLGNMAALETAEYMEYDWHPERFLA